MEQIRSRVDSIVKDPATAEALKPYYRQFCKRPCFHDEYLDSYNRDNVTLVDTRRPRRRADHAQRHRGRRPRVRAGLHRLRHRLRGRHRLHPSCRLRPDRPRRRHIEREVGRGCIHVPWHAHPRLPERVHLQPRAIWFHCELPPHARRAEQARRLHPGSRPRQRRTRGRDHARKPKRRGWRPS